MATIRDKLGHWASGVRRHDNEDDFAFSLITRTQWLKTRVAVVPRDSVSTDSGLGFSG